MRKLMKKDGFTLIELMIVVVIIGILAAIAIPKFTAVSKGAKQAEAEPILKQICTLASAHQMKAGANATAIDSLKADGWADPNAKYFDTWTYTPGTAPVVGSAKATPKTGIDLQTATMDCDNNTVTLS